MNTLRIVRAGALAALWLATCAAHAIEAPKPQPAPEKPRGSGAAAADCHADGRARVLREGPARHGLSLDARAENSCRGDRGTRSRQRRRRGCHAQPPRGRGQQRGGHRARTRSALVQLRQPAARRRSESADREAGEGSARAACRARRRRDVRGGRLHAACARWLQQGALRLHRHRGAFAGGRGHGRSGERHRARAVPPRPRQARSDAAERGEEELSACGLQGGHESADRRAARADHRERQSDPRAVEDCRTHDPAGEAGPRQLHGSRLRRPSRGCVDRARLRHRRRSRRRADCIRVDGAHAMGRAIYAAANAVVAVLRRSAERGRLHGRRVRADHARVRADDRAAGKKRGSDKYWKKHASRPRRCGASTACAPKKKTAASSKLRGPARFPASGRCLPASSPTDIGRSTCRCGRSGTSRNSTAGRPRSRSPAR